MNLVWLFWFCFCATRSLGKQLSRRADAGATDESKFRIRTLVERKSYLVPLKTRFILKCSSSQFETNEAFGDQFDDDRPELIVLNSLEQTKKLVDYLAKNSASKIDLIGWNKTGLERVHRRGQEKEKSGSKHPKTTGQKAEGQFDKMYETMFLSGKGFFQPDESVELFAQGHGFLLFTSFGKKDEAIYSCFYKPKLDWSNLLSDFGSWMSRLSRLADLGNNLGNNLGTNSNGDNSLADALAGLNLNNNVPLAEKLLYATCLLTWPFNRECHLVKQFKLTIESESKEKTPGDFLNGLDSYEKFKLKKLLKQLVKHCHPISSALSSGDRKALQKGSSQRGDPKRGDPKRGDSKSGGPKDEAGPGFVGDLFRLLFDDLLVNGFMDLINSVFSGLFSGMFGDLFGGLFSGLFSGLFNGLFSGLIHNLVGGLFSGLINIFSGTAGELFHALMGELFVDLFKAENLFYLICIALFIWCSAAQDEPKRPKKLALNDKSDESGIDLHIDAQIDARLGEEASSAKDVSGRKNMDF